jgi:hypothetical protein
MKIQITVDGFNLEGEEQECICATPMDIKFQDDNSLAEIETRLKESVSIVMSKLKEAHSNI